MRRDPQVTHVHAVPGNPGMWAQAKCHELPEGIEDGDAVAKLAVRIGADLVVIGPEAPLVAGVADAVRAAGVACFGPSAQAARLEGSKAFAKDIMAAADVPTALAHVCTGLEQVMDALDAFGPPYVVKDDGLAAGKGVVVTPNRGQALAHAAQCLERETGPGEAPPQVVIEEFLDGPEVSLFCVTDGVSVAPLTPAQDFKRLLDDDQGPNTGGMGAYSPLPWAPAGLTAQVVERIAEPTIRAMRERGTPFAGILYVGLALTSRGLRVVEFNARFGDPETQVVLDRLRTPLGGLLYAAATGTLGDLDELAWHPHTSVTVVLAANGYPDGPRRGDPITGLETVHEPAYVLHAGTRKPSGSELLSHGGRVLSVVASGDDLDQARERVYAAIAGIELRGSQYRHDIALAAAQGRVAAPAAGRD
nr:phosphoribosylamine--glycine ligase [Kineosphaera limosa]